MADKSIGLNNSSKNPEEKLFVKLLSANHHRIYGFILSLVSNDVDAEDIMQDTSELLWRKYDQFEPGTDFVAWAVTVAKFQVLNYRKKKRLNVPLSKEVIDLIAEESEKILDESTERFNALKKCVAKLNSKDLMFIKLRYRERFSARIIAQRIGESIKTVYRNEARIKGFLSRCIRNVLAT